MDAKIKAKELIENFAETIPHKLFGQLIERDWETAKKCALKAVDEILNLEVWGWPHNTPEGELFYQNVRKEIEKL